jgi:branched-subunit amino acid aminotransferase/4-amino-4-deoxychorismate lyase
MSLKPNLIIACEPPYSPLKKDEDQGIKLITSVYMRPFPMSKTTCYIEAVRLEPQKRKAGALEILFIYNKTVFECSTSNIFIVKKGAIYTPKENVLHGITRKAVINLAKKAGYVVIEKDISEKELFSADEVFITATNKKILPVIKIDSKKIANGKVGNITKILQVAFTNYISSY